MCAAFPERDQNDSSQYDQWSQRSNGPRLCKLEFLPHATPGIDFVSCFFCRSFESMQRLCDKYNRAIDSIHQLVSSEGSRVCFLFFFMFFYGATNEETVTSVRDKHCRCKISVTQGLFSSETCFMPRVSVSISKYPSPPRSGRAPPSP